MTFKPYYCKSLPQDKHTEGSLTFVTFNYFMRHFSVLGITYSILRRTWKLTITKYIYAPKSL